MHEITLTLPYPPSVNSYKRIGRTITTKKGKIYQQRVNSPETKRFYFEVWAKVMSLKASKTDFKPYGKEILLGVTIGMHPPDKRRHDIDNILKTLLDSLQKAGIFEDDNQITRLFVEKKAIIPGGQVNVKIYPIGVAYE